MRAIAVTVALTGAMAVAATSTKEPGNVTPLICMDNEMREELRVLMYRGIDQAMTHHVVRMFDIWMKDATGQPNRAVTGMRNAVKAYVGSRTVVTNWQPQPCP